MIDSHIGSILLLSVSMQERLLESISISIAIQDKASRHNRPRA